MARGEGQEGEGGQEEEEESRGAPGGGGVRSGGGVSGERRFVRGRRRSVDLIACPCRLMSITARQPLEEYVRYERELMEYVTSTGNGIHKGAIYTVELLIVLDFAIYK